ncbi:MAG: pimelyl-ACP methyl ester esterase BioV [Campylobacterales bacterium]|nr:pimelyl-ACP methyl ester esterase BioV [Campylobacterales bacterium]
MFFSGFGFCYEEILFEKFYKKNDFTVAGFSLGAIKAFEYTLNSKQRVDNLILLSPAFFNDKDEKFKRLQLLHFNKNRELYIKNFLDNVKYPSHIDISQFMCECVEDDLKFLLNYYWNEDKLKYLNEKGVKIEVFLGKADKIINSKVAVEFFKKHSTAYFFNDYGHLLNS